MHYFDTTSLIHLYKALWPFYKIKEGFLTILLFDNNEIKNIDLDSLNYEIIVKIASSHLMVPALYEKI